MDSRIPVPTDNIYKFYALFGLLLFIFSLGSFFYVQQTYNQQAFELVPQLEELKEIESPSSAERARISVIERKFEINSSDKTFLLFCIGGLSGIALVLMGMGFVPWHTRIQPTLDRTNKAQAEITELQAIKLRRELGFPDETPPKLVAPEQTECSEQPTPLTGAPSPSVSSSEYREVI